MWWTQPRVYLGLLLVDAWGKLYSRIQQQKLRSDSVWRDNDREILQMYECVILKTSYSLSLALWAFCVVSVGEHEWPRQYGGRQVLWAKEHHRQSERPDQSRSMSGYLPCICSRWVKPVMLTSNLLYVQQGCDTLKYSTWHKTWESFFLCSIVVLCLVLGGYDLAAEGGVKAMLDEFDQEVGLHYLKAIHLNDSKGIARA